MTKLSKSEVNYRVAATGQNCGICGNLTGPSVCALVAGPVDEAHMCDRFYGRGRSPAGGSSESEKPKEPGGLEPADHERAKSMAASVLRSKAGIASLFRQLWRHKYVEHNYDADKAWKLFYWPITHSGAGGDGYNPETRKAASKLLVQAFNKWAKADMKTTVKRADGDKEMSVGDVSQAEFAKWFMSGAPAVSEDFGIRYVRRVSVVAPSLSDLFVEQSSDDPENADLDDPEVAKRRAEKLGFELKDVQAYYDMQVVQSLTPPQALSRTKKKFKLKVIKVSPIGKVMAPGVPDLQTAPPPAPVSKEPEEPEEPEEPKQKPLPPAAGRSTMAGGRYPEGPRGPEGAPGPK